MHDALNKVPNVNEGYCCILSFGAPKCISINGCHCDGANSVFTTKSNNPGLRKSRLLVPRMTHSINLQEIKKNHSL